MSNMQASTGARLLIDALAAQGVDIVFCVPGESYLAAVDALYDRRDEIRLIVCRHEGSATFMAEAYAKASGKPGICFVTRAPGATQAAIGLHTAHQDSTPLILFIGQVNRDFIEREAFQEVDYRRMFAPVTKWVSQIDDPARMPEMVSRAFHIAMSGRRGPVVLALPEDVLAAVVAAPQRIARPPVLSQVTPDAAGIACLLERIKQAERPLLVLGGSGWTQEAVNDMRRFVHASGLPVACSFRRQDLFDNRDPQYIGVLGLGADPALQKAVKEADLLLLFGARMGEVPSSGYTLIDSPQPEQWLVHAMPCAEELGRVYRPDLALVTAMPALARSLAALSQDKAQLLPPRVKVLHEGYLRFSQPAGLPADSPTADGMVRIDAAWLLLREQLPDDVIITNGAGNYTAWAHRYHRYKCFGSQVAPTSGAMGYGLPAAIGARLACPQRPVLCLAGDGCFMMSSHELATAVRLKLPIVIIVFDNQMYGTIRMHQEKWFPRRVHGTDLENPDFVALAHAFGAHGMKIESPAALVQAVLAGFEADRPTLLHVSTDPELIGPGGSIDSIRNNAEKNKP
jgi:acetolactate synthase-1/2/3 large subunit